MNPPRSSRPECDRQGVERSIRYAAPEAKPAETRTVDTGFCRVLSDGTVSGVRGPSNLPTLAFTIGPGAALAKEMQANQTTTRAPGGYENEIRAIYLSKTALEGGYGGLDAVVMSPDGHSGTFITNDRKASGRFDCGALPAKL